MHNTTSNSGGSAPGGSWSDTSTGIRDSKGGMMKAVNSDPKGSSPSVRWRLPTRWDFEQADVDGIRWVLPHFKTKLESVWTATTYTYYMNSAWNYSTDTGALLSGGSRAGALSVRCVGR